jgi:hypothetical protein
MIGSRPVGVTLEVMEPTGPARVDASAIEDLQQRRIFLNIENIKSNKRSPPFDVYLNLQPGEPPHEHPEWHAGSLPMFGLLEASRDEGGHSDSGLFEQFDVTRLYARLPLLQGWDPHFLTVTFVPRNPATSPDIEVGRVSLYFG